ncbi:chemotaxis protein CheW [Imhoffiella purpurea]|uniref:Positive regulator of CheA protein activity (CheW) n=1 Tax=Imhoffiella purpurea TaxID=1249627 RepID=W9V3G2_9GAMM|nr:chemotaxis protein CheW [Imhoffiella purpurea]EXJ13844.1 Positive regulator of CheA protein activity (CheW) [Imhoffiella purpurea]
MTRDTTLESGQEKAQYLIFNLRGEPFAIPLLGVKEIIEYGSVTHIPNMPVFIRGVINLRGRVVPVIDLAARFGEPPTTVGERTCVVIVELQDEAGINDMGIVVDGVNAVSDIPASEIEPPPRFGAKIRVDFIQGMWKSQDRFVIVLDQARVLSIQEINQLAEMMEDGPAR